MQKFLDLSQTRCPLTFVLAKRAIVALNESDSLALTLCSTESAEDIRLFALKQSRQSDVTENKAHIAMTVYAVTKG